MGKRDDEKLPTLIVPPAEGDSSLDSVPLDSTSGFLSEDAVATAMNKVAALERFLAAGIRESNFSEFIRDILVAVMHVVKSEAGSILEIDPKNESMFFRAVVGSSSDRVVNFVIPKGQGIVGHVAESKAPLVVDDLSTNEIHLKSIEKVVNFEGKNLVALPIIIRGKVFGVLELMNRVGDSRFSPRDVELLSYLCNMAAKAIETRLMIAWVHRERHESSSTNS